MNNIKNLEKLLSAEDLTDSIIEIDAFINELSNYGGKLGKLSEGQKVILFNQNFERDINNGGFNQFFFNSSGEFTFETLDSLKAIGANKTADILWEAITQFPNKIVPKNDNLRQDLIEQIEDVAEEAWEVLEERFQDYEDDLTALNISYKAEYRSILIYFSIQFNYYAIAS